MNTGLSPGARAGVIVAALALFIVGIPRAVYSAGAGACPDKMAVIRMFYDSNDASQFSASLAYLHPGIVFTAWGEGMNGRHWHEKKLIGREKIAPLLGDRGLRRLPPGGSGPVFRVTEEVVAADRVTFMLRPDRISPSGRLYNPYRVEAIFEGCVISQLTIVELFTGV